MRAVVVLALVLVACDSQAPGGTLGLPTPRPTPAATAVSPGGTARSTASPGVTTGASSSPGASASASPSGSAAPAKLVGANATQFLLTVRYGAAMRSATACGAVGQPSSLDGAIDRVASYTSNDAALIESLKTSVSATVDAGCSAVTFVLGIAAPSGTFTLTANGVSDRDGRAIDQTAASASLTIADEGRPRATGASSQGNRVVVQFSEPMRELGVTGVAQLVNYQLDNAPVDATGITCTDAGCRGLALDLRSPLVAGRSYTLRVASVADRAGLLISPDPTTLTFAAKP